MGVFVEEGVSIVHETIPAAVKNTNIFIQTTIMVEIKIDLGIVFSGFFTSSLIVVINP
jgi:hypothetical protein